MLVLSAEEMRQEDALQCGPMTAVEWAWLATSRRLWNSSDRLVERSVCCPSSLPCLVQATLVVYFIAIGVSTIPDPTCQWFPINWRMTL